MRTKPFVLMLQLPVPNNAATNVPLAAGYLKAYAHSRGLLEHIDIELVPRALADHAGDALLVEQIVAQAPDLLALSLYTWNSERSLAIAERVRRRLPGLIVVVGGPEVQHDNQWVIEHPAIDIAVVGEGEQTFADILAHLAAQRRIGALALDAGALAHIPGIIFRDGARHLTTPDRVALADLALVPSPYLLGYLDVAPGEMLMVEVSRWCPYACSFCLYGRNMGARLGNRLFPLERVLGEIRWGYVRGLRRVHFIEANLNLVPIFQPLMHELAQLNAGGELQLYAELRGEHLRDDTVAQLARAGLRVAEVGLQTANPEALRVAHRRTDLAKWAAGTRRLYQHGVDVLLDVIVGLPADDAAGIAQTLDFLDEQDLGAFDAFTLQLLPGTAVRREAEQYALRFQEQPPYYVLGTDRLSFADIRRLRRDLKQRAGIDPNAVEGSPTPRLTALALGADAGVISAVDLACLPDADTVVRLATHVDVRADWRAAQREWLAGAIDANPSSVFDVYLLGDQAPEPHTLAAWRNALPFQPGYLDRCAVYHNGAPEPQFRRVSPRLWLVVPWTSQVDPGLYAGIAEIVWAYDMCSDSVPPLASWERAGGAGIWVRDRSEASVAQWRPHTSALIWSGQRSDNAD